MDETELVPTEPLTVILSENGWVRAAKGHEIDPKSLNYRSGDGFQAVAYGRSNQPAVFLDSTGRSYALAAHTLPSARGLGEPVASRLNPPEGASFVGVMMGETDSLYLLASDAGYGFLAKLDDLFSKNKNGKAILSVAKGGNALTPAVITDESVDRVAAVSSSGRLLVIAAAELPQMTKGKGLKIINIPSARFRAGEERVVAVAVLPESADLGIIAGQRKMLIKSKDIPAYMSERGRRGQLLPRGYRNISALFIENHQGG